MSYSLSNDLYFILNGNLLEIDKFSSSEIKGDTVIYEVVRVKKSAPVFLREHIGRLHNSINLAKLKQLDYDELNRSIVELLLKNPVDEKNIKIVVNYTHQVEFPQYLIFFIPSKYLSSLEREKGVYVETINATRLNPEIKAENKSLRSYADTIIHNSGCYEVLMINEQGLITEGSRSNVFFVMNGKLFTAPSADVLGGITREKVIHLSNKLGIEVVFNSLKSNELKNIEGAFLTGTSPGVLPIAKIDDIKLNVNVDLINQISCEYEKLVNAEIANWRSINH